MLCWDFDGLCGLADHIEGIPAISGLLFGEVGLEEVGLEVLNRVIDELLSLLSSLTINVELLQLVLLDHSAFRLQDLREIAIDGWHT